MSSTYQSFLRSPNASYLAPNAALHYVTTTTTIAQPDAIVKHLQAQARQVEKKEEKVLNLVEGSNGFCLETETVYEFKKGGGTLLPGMDENLLADVTAVSVVVHVVSLDDSGKISQIRLHWDQATLLKQVEAIGKTGRNWPICDGKEQVKTVKQSIRGSGQVSSSSGSLPSRSKDDFNNRLFATGHDQDRPSTSANVSGVEPREASRPQERQWAELFPGEHDRGARSTSPGARSEHDPVLKGGAGKHFKDNRLFDPNDTNYRERSPERKQPDPTKNNHFEFGDGQDEPPQSQRLGLRATKQTSNINFEDFNTPAKHVPRPNPEQDRHFGYGIDDDDKTPFKRNVVHAPRPDAKSNFEMTDEVDSSSRNNPLKTITNVNAARRHQDMDPHFAIKNTSSPAGPNENFEPTPRPSGKPRSDQVSNWSFADQTAETPAKSNKIYKTAGDGMGGRANTRFWDVAGDDAPEQYGGKGGQKQVYKTAGNGMGGRKGHGLSWSIGDPDAM